MLITIKIDERRLTRQEYDILADAIKAIDHLECVDLEVTSDGTAFGIATAITLAPDYHNKLYPKPDGIWNPNIPADGS